MENILNCYKFSKSFHYYISLENNKILIVANSRFFVFKIPPTFFYKLDNTKKKLSFLFLKKKFYIGFLRHLFNFYSRFFTFYYFNLKLKGLGYRIMRVAKNLIKIYYNRNNFFYMHLPSCILFKYRTRKLFFISSCNETLSVIMIGLLYLKEFVIYKQQGLYYPRQILLIKPGKNKFR